MNANENTHDPLIDRAVVSFDLAAEHHLASCAPCQAERDHVEDALKLFAAANREYASRPENFWEMQAARIRSAQKESVGRSRRIMALVPSIAVLLLAAGAILGRTPGVRPVASAPKAATAQVDPDHELLLEVERAIQADTPRALEPVMLIVEESEGNLPLHTSSERKEIRSHEN
ncbi:MAG TPA: hypothetical protein VEU94_08330 [Terriglobales bacterium]|nr:hypothetical protein [Terriglobales bacterium]